MYWGYIYCITCVKTGKAYIGQTIRTIDVRLMSHLKAALKRNSEYTIHKAIRKYGLSCFEIEELDCVECETLSDLKDDLDNLEKFYIQYYDTYHDGYNMTVGGQGTQGLEFSEKSKKKFYDKMKVYWRDEGFRRKLSDSAKLRFSDKEERRLQSERMKRVHKRNPKLHENLKLSVKLYFEDKNHRLAQAKRCKEQWKNDDGRLKRGLEKAQEKAHEVHKRKVAQFDLNGNFVAVFDSVTEATRGIGRKSANISACCKRKPKHDTAGGFIWRYVDEFKDGIPSKIGVAFKPFNWKEHYDKIHEKLKVKIHAYKNGKLFKEFASIKEAYLYFGVTRMVLKRYIKRGITIDGCLLKRIELK